MAIQWVALAIFVGVFVVGTLRKINIGVLMFAAASLVGIGLAGMPLDEVVGGFPVGILVLLVGVTYFFGIAHVNGTIDRIVESSLAKVGDRTAVLPTVFFVLSAGLASMGAPLGALVLFPVGMVVADKRGIDPMLMALAMGTGLSAGAFAPTSLFGIVAYGTAQEAGIALSPLVLFAVALGINIVLFACAYVLFGRRRVLRADTEQRARARSLATVGGGLVDGGSADEPPSPGGSDHSGERAASPSFTPVQIMTVLCMIGLVGTVVVLSLVGADPEIGVLGFAFGAVLTLLDPDAGRKAVGRIDWQTVLLVGGIITFVGVLDHIGAIDMLGELATDIGSPLLAALFLCFVAALVSAFASTTGMLAALVPLTLPLVASGSVPGWALICALAVCASIVDVSPFSTVGATCVASTVDEAQRPRMTRLLTRWGLSLVVLGPLVLVGVLVLPGIAL
ncbi:SLC13 family permease [Prescottella sp. R16]|uniref:SLC13 family permease n=1 Tax=Prescottella sp. R16 TaxID=3064529 RepID=UPI00272DF4AB|nr:SLC13 family permease [Prescottella sp. R16]